MFQQFILISFERKNCQKLYEVERNTHVTQKITDYIRRTTRIWSYTKKSLTNLEKNYIEVAKIKLTSNQGFNVCDTLCYSQYRMVRSQKQQKVVKSPKKFKYEKCSLCPAFQVSTKTNLRS